MSTQLLSEHRRDVLLLIFTIAGMLFLVSRGIFLTITGFMSLTSFVALDSSHDLLGPVSMYFCAALLIPLLVYCIRRLKDGEIPPAKVGPVLPLQLAGITLVWVLMIFLGSILTERSRYGDFIAIPVFLLGISAPVVGIAWIAVGGLRTGSQRRLRAAFGIGLAGSTLVAMILEYLLVGMGVLIAGIVAALDPQLRTVLQHVVEQVNNGGDIQNMLTSLAPFLTNPLVLLLALLFASVFAPIIEESLKPLAVWLLGKRLHSPAEGFALGALCGAGFAMLEGMQAAGGMSPMLGIGIAARAASTLMHITASGLMGWGIASARLEQRYGRLCETYIISLSIHGLWNGSVVLAVFGALRLTLEAAGTDYLGMLLVVVGIGALILLLITIAIILPVINHRLRPASGPRVAPPQSDIIAPLQS